MDPRRSPFFPIATLALTAVLALLLPALAPRSAAQEPTTAEALFPDRTYDPSIPHPDEFLGYGPGERHTDYHGLMSYLRALDASSDRVAMGSYGVSWEGRELPWVMVSSEANIARLEEIQADLQRLRDPRGLSDAEAEAILDRTPALVHLNSATHGNENSSTESSYRYAYELAAGTDARTAAMRDAVVVLFTPTLSPDGHNRFVTWYNANQVGAQGTPDPSAAEHFAPWGMDTNNNHYQINPNRESVWSTQRETAATVRLLQQWPAQVFVDHHGLPEEYIGPWNVEPLHVEITEDQKDWSVRYGEALAGAFRDNGYPYYPWEFGLEYPGYWDTLPIFNGAIAFTFESGGGGWKGIRLRTRHGHITTFREGVLKNLLGDDVVVQVTADARREKLAGYLEYRRSALREAAAHPVKGYALSAGNDPARLETVVNMLRRNGVEVERFTEAATVTGHDYMAPGRPEVEATLPAGSILLPMQQPQARLLRVMMEPQTEFSEEHLDRVREQRELAKTAGFLNPNIWSTGEPFYDVTAWSVPYTYGLEAYELTAEPTAATEPVTEDLAMAGEVVAPESRHAWAISWASNRAIAAVGELRREGIRYRVASAAFRVGEREFPAGSPLVFAHENEQLAGGHASQGEALARTMAEIAAATGVTVVGIDTNLTDAGPNIGSDQFVSIVQRPIAVVRGGPIRPSAYGAIWYLLEQVHHLEFTALEFDDLWRTDLRPYGVIVLPDGFYTGMVPGMAEATAERLRRWMLEGGSLVAIKGAAAWLTTPSLDITSVRTRDPYVGKSIYMTDGGHPPLQAPVTEADLRMPDDEQAGAREEGAASVEQMRTQDTPMLHGAVLRARTFGSHWLSYGFGDEVPVTIWSNLIFRTGQGVGVPLYYGEADTLLVSGFAFDDSLQALEGTGYLMEESRGNGRVILFADDPNFRLYWDGLARLFANALLLSNSF